MLKLPTSVDLSKKYKSHRYRIVMYWVGVSILTDNIIFNRNI